MQRFRVHRPVAVSYDRNVQEVLDKWRVHDLNAISVSRLDRLLAEHFDDLYWQGYQAEVASRLIASLCHRRPSLGRGGVDVLPEARSALAGFRAHAHSQSRLPLAKPWVFAVVGLAWADKEYELALGLLMGWDAFLRLPSDLGSLLTTSLVGPGRGPVPRWGLLLYPEEGMVRSKTAAFDEGVLLRHPCWQQGGDRALQRLRAGRKVGQHLFGFTSLSFSQKFASYLHQVPEATAGGASGIRRRKGPNVWEELSEVKLNRCLPTILPVRRR